MSQQEVIENPQAIIEQQRKYIQWVQPIMREHGLCKDGGTCHHGCKKNDPCFREECCAPLSGSGMNDQWEVGQVKADCSCETPSIKPNTPWPTPEQVEKIIRLSGKEFKDLTTEQAISAVVLAYKANAAQQ